MVNGDYEASGRGGNWLVSAKYRVVAASVASSFSDTHNRKIRRRKE